MNQKGDKTQQETSKGTGNKAKQTMHSIPTRRIWQSIQRKLPFSSTSSTRATTSVNKVKHRPEVVVLDGGMGHHLRALGVEIAGEVGSLCRFLGVSMANVERPQLVIQAHLDFMDAGANVITTNSYAVTPRVFQLATASTSSSGKECTSSGATQQQQLTLEDLLVAACRAAHKARDLRPKRRDIQIAACLPPLAESYRPDKVGQYKDNLCVYKRIVSTIAPHCDLILCETLSTIDEARAACAAVAAYLAENDNNNNNKKLPVWVSWTLDEDKQAVLRSGQTLEDAVSVLVGEHPDLVEAFLVNCTSPESITASLPTLRHCVPRGTAVGGYANGFVTAESGEGEYRRDLNPEEYCGKFVAPWIQSGANVVGGCCGVFPPHIAAIRRYLDKRLEPEQLTCSDYSST